MNNRRRHLAAAAAVASAENYLLLSFFPFWKIITMMITAAAVAARANWNREKTRERVKPPNSLKSLKESRIFPFFFERIFCWCVCVSYCYLSGSSNFDWLTDYNCSIACHIHIQDCSFWFNLCVNFRALPSTVTTTFSSSYLGRIYLNMSVCACLFVSLRLPAFFLT